MWNLTGQEGNIILIELTSSQFCILIFFLIDIDFTTQYFEKFHTEDIFSPTVSINGPILMFVFLRLDPGLGFTL